MSECFAVAYHIENLRPNHRRLPDHSDVRRLLRENESVHLMVLLDHARIGDPAVSVIVTQR